MAILAIFTGTGTTKQIYEALRSEVNWETDRPTGGLFHACAFDEEGNLHVAEVWESVEAMTAFMRRRLLPSMKKLGVPPPDVRAFPAHNIIVYPAAQKYLLKSLPQTNEDEDLRAALLEGLRDDGYRD